LPVPASLSLALMTADSGPGARRLSLALLTALAMPLAACTSGGPVANIDTAPTGQVAGAAPVAPEQLSDQATVRNAVSSADLAGLGTQPLAWANPETGSRGAITAVAEQRQNGQLCRKFTTSRESFDGVAMYRGEACMAQAGVWKLLDFKPL
jgi:surface antigen